MGFLLSPNSAEPGRFQPALYRVPYDFRGFVSGGDAVRYTLRVGADGMGEADPRVVEVAWDGQWTSDLDQLAYHLTVKLLAA